MVDSGNHHFDVSSQERKKSERNIVEFTNTSDVVVPQAHGLILSAKTALNPIPHQNHPDCLSDTLCSIPTPIQEVSSIEPSASIVTASQSYHLIHSQPNANSRSRDTVKHQSTLSDLNPDPLPTLARATTKRIQMIVKDVVEDVVVLRDTVTVRHDEALADYCAIFITTLTVVTMADRLQIRPPFGEAVDGVVVSDVQSWVLSTVMFLTLSVVSELFTQYLETFFGLEYYDYLHADSWYFSLGHVIIIAIVSLMAVIGIYGPF
ncbi:hypothetical protein BC829DRAFT_271377 [Chytridium lagenaria]|nr:hypothetical protein BC829DRAFT_271377 [Chytridium lagenaria]